ncbi:hypothetical protein [Pseudescherichia sp.]|uniref:hypothetical protein n=1 Tax=Pseudescherichia sp. TaxID=2055881 RepID=UPI0028984D61|nr:hypothetical protein [Pseudescherichia sp.]
MARTIVLKISKLIFFIVIFLVVGKCMGDPYIYINHDIASSLAQFLSGDVNAESLYDAYFYIDVASVIVITVAIYNAGLFIYKKFR